MPSHFRPVQSGPVTADKSSVSGVDCTGNPAPSATRLRRQQRAIGHGGNDLVGACRCQIVVAPEQDRPLRPGQDGRLLHGPQDADPRPAARRPTRDPRPPAPRDDQCGRCRPCTRPCRLPCHRQQRCGPMRACGRRQSWKGSGPGQALPPHAVPARGRHHRAGPVFCRPNRHGAVGGWPSWASGAPDCAERRTGVHPSEPPGEVGLQPVVADAVRELADIGQSERRLGLTIRSAPISISAVFPATGTPPTVKPAPGALMKASCAVRRQIAEGILPGDRPAGLQHHAVGQGDARCDPKADRAIADARRSRTIPTVRPPRRSR